MQMIGCQINKEGCQINKELVTVSVDSIGSKKVIIILVDIPQTKPSSI